MIDTNPLLKRETGGNTSLSQLLLTSPFNSSDNRFISHEGTAVAGSGDVAMDSTTGQGSYGGVPESPVSQAVRETRRQGTRMQEGEQVPLAVLPFFRFLSEEAKRNVMQQLIDNFQATSMMGHADESAPLQASLPTPASAATSTASSPSGLAFMRSPSFAAHESASGGVNSGVGGGGQRERDRVYGVNGGHGQDQQGVTTLSSSPALTPRSFLAVADMMSAPSPKDVGSDPMTVDPVRLGASGGGTKPSLAASAVAAVAAATAVAVPSVGGRSINRGISAGPPLHRVGSAPMLSGTELSSVLSPEQRHPPKERRDSLLPPRPTGPRQMSSTPLPQASNDGNNSSGNHDMFGIAKGPNSHFPLIKNSISSEMGTHPHSSAVDIRQNGLSGSVAPRNRDGRNHTSPRTHMRHSSDSSLPLAAAAAAAASELGTEPMEVERGAGVLRRSPSR
ncbi:unnamed protein product [Choristocarpus tenellus]